MKIELDDKSIDKIARRIVELQRSGTANDMEMLSTQEAAQMLKISTDRIRHLKDKFPHIRVGGANGRLLFYKSGIINYLKQ